MKKMQTMNYIWYRLIIKLLHYGCQKSATNINQDRLSISLSMHGFTQQTVSAYEFLFAFSLNIIVSSFIEYKIIGNAICKCLISISFFLLS